MTEEQRQLCMDFQAVFDTPIGKRVYAAIKEFSTYDQRYSPSVHPSVTWCDLGMRNMFLFIKDKVEADTSQPEQQQKAEGKSGINKENRQQTEAVQDAGNE